MVSFRRRNFLINKPFQLRFSVYVCSWIFALSLIYPYIIYNLFGFFLKYMSRDPSGPPPDSLVALKGQMLGMLITTQAVFLLLIFAISVFMAHRIAGPLFKLRKTLDESASGAIETALKFRKADHFQELTGSYNRFASAMASTINAQSDFAAQAQAHLSKAMADATPGSRAELERALAALREIRPAKTTRLGGGAPQGELTQPATQQA